MNGVPIGLVNLRDLGAAGPLPRAGVLLRSDAPLAGDVAPDVAAWPPGTVIDLRGQAERQETHPLAEVATIVDLPLFGGGQEHEPGEHRVPRRWPDRLAGMYVSLLSPPLAGRLVEAVRVIATAVPPVLVHCTAGKDRTGVTVALALRLVGVERDAILADYLLTGAAMPQVLARMGATVREETAGTSLAKPPPHIVAAPREAMAEFIDTLDAQEGGAEGWFLRHGGDDATVTRLADRLLGAGPDQPGGADEMPPS